MRLQKFSSKKVIITGACGTIGAELVRQLVNGPAEHIVCLDNNETELFFQQEQYRSTGRVSCYLADVRDLDALKLRFQGGDVVLHAAALKHVGLCEDSPNQAVSTNIQGTQNVIDAALENGVERVIYTSSDKAVNPTNVMGTSKLMGERLMTAASESNSSHSTVFASTRFGNVLGSRGSVVPIFSRQIADGGPITLTDKSMTRFIMTLSEAAELVLDSVWLAHGGEVMVTKMPAVKIQDIAYVMRDGLSDGREIDIVETGLKPGEKMYEELMNGEEIRRTWEYGSYFVILSAFANPNADEYAHLSARMQADHPYNSAHATVMTREEVAEFFHDRDLLV